MEIASGDIFWLTKDTLRMEKLLHIKIFA
jgi:hypothetical protein